MNYTNRQRIVSAAIIAMIGLAVFAVGHPASAAERVYTDSNEGWSLRFPSQWAVTRFESGGVDFRPIAQDYPTRFRSTISHTGIYYGVQVFRLSLTPAERRALAKSWNDFVQAYIDFEALTITDHPGAAQRRVAKLFHPQEYWLNNYKATMVSRGSSLEANYKYILVSRDHKTVFLIYRFSLGGAYKGVTVDPRLFFDRDFRNVAQSFRILAR